MKMKKILLSIPIIALAGIGTYYTTIPYLSPSSKIENKVVNPQILFITSEHDLRKLIRHGDAQSAEKIQTSLAAIEIKLHENHKKGYAVENLLNMLHSYDNDYSILAKTFTPLLEQIRQSDQFEQTNKQSFQSTLEQIGLYELKRTYADLESVRKDYIKEPTNKTKIEYENYHSHIKQIINELYLDASIDTPLYQYLDNHKRYFDLISNAYTTVQYDRISRLHSNANSIKTELQILPVN